MAPPIRRRSIDSSSGSSSSEPHDQSQSSEKRADMLKGDGSSRGAQASPDPPKYSPPTYAPPPPAAGAAATAPKVPPSGYRIPLSTPGPAFPGVDKTRAAPFADANESGPVFLGSALMQYSVHPCKIAPHLAAPCRVPYGGVEFAHQGRYDLLPFVPEHMEFVATSNGRVPDGRRPIKGGFENTGAELYHAVAVIGSIKVPGKTGTHLGGCNVAYGGREHTVTENYEILCWKI